MKKNYFVVAMLIALCFAMQGCTTKTDPADTTAISGLVEATDWDENDNVTEVAIMVTAPENDQESGVIGYFVSKNENETELHNLIGLNVEAKGVISEDSEGRKIILIKSFKVLESEDTGYSDEDEF